MDLLSIIKPIEEIDITDEDGSNPRKASFYDADTFTDDKGQSYRMPNASAEETWSTMSGILQPAQAGAAEMTTQTALLAKHFGFNRVPDGDAKSYDRNVQGLINDSGQSLSDFQIENRLSGANQNTSNEVLNNRMLNSFVDTLDMKFSGSEVTTRARDAINDAIRGADVQPTWKTRADDEEQLELARSLYSHKEIAELAEAFKNETDPVEKQRMQDALYYAKQTSNPFSGVEVRHNDRDMRNKAYSQAGTSLELGLEATAQSLYGLMDMAGDSTGWETLRERASAGMIRSEQRSANKGTVLTSYNDIDDAGDAFTWVTNNAAMSLPFMGAVVAGGLLTAPLGGVAALGTAGALAVGSIPSTILTAGSIWNAMPKGEKSAPIALAAGFAVGLLDRFGFKGTPKSLTAGAAAQKGSMKDLFTSIQSEVVELLVTNKGWSKARAIKEVAKGSKSQLVKMGDDLGNFASSKLRDLNLVKGAIRQIAVATTREAATETVQSAIEEVAAVTGNSAELDPTVFKEVLITSAVIGGVFGSGFSMPSVTKQFMDRRAILHDVANPTKTASDLDQMRQEDQEEAQRNSTDPTGENGSIDRTNNDNLADFENLKSANLVEGVFDELVSEGKIASEEKGFIKNTLKSLTNNPAGTWKAHLLHMIDKIGLKDANGDRRVLLSRLGSVLGELGINSGPSHQEYIMGLRGTLTEMIPDIDTVAQKLGVNRRTANRLVREALEASDRGEVYNGPKAVLVAQVLEDFREAQFQLKGKLEELGLQEIGLAEAAAELTGDLDILRNRQLDQRKIRNDLKDFQDALIAAGVPTSEAKVYTDRLLSDQAAEAALELHELGYTNSGALSPYMSGNVIGAYTSGLSSLAKRVGDTKYLGKNRQILDKVMDALMNGESKDAKGEITRPEAAELARNINEYLEIANGEYGTWDSPFINAVQDNLILVTFLRGMGFSALASWPELALTQLGVPQHVAFNHVSGHAKYAAKSFAEYMNYMASALPFSPIPRNIYNSSEGSTAEEFAKTPQELLKGLGYTGSEASAVKQYGIEIDDWRMVIAEHYAKAVGLNNITDYTRGVRASMAADVIDHYVSIIANSFSSVRTNMEVEAYTELRELGVDIEFMVNHYQQVSNNPNLELSREEQAKLRSNIEIGTLRFVDQAIVNPLPGRVPKGYKFRKLALFNQFQGFIANFTSKILPKIMRQVSSGSPGVTANALAVALTMMAAAMFATMLRDEIKYGGTTPYLDDYDKFRRVVFASGLLGTGERILSGIDPMYGSRPIMSSDNALGSSVMGAVEGVLGEAAGYGTVKDVANSAYELSFGDNYKAAKSAAKLVPILGSVNQVRDGLLDNLFKRGN